MTHITMYLRPKQEYIVSFLNSRIAPIFELVAGVTDGSNNI